ncbi:cytochrome c biogenesis protein CcsA [Macrococcoides bohemicum]|uniref:cytochrome c biogenesis protein CcsA n=1 Tax=Macrococcoides bohemicum TaxID=1903056 RepID=UPI000BB5327E|nr:MULTISPECIES: cytochrome c biogenesis protein CcsA [Macrococcus]ATD30091.1 cytochrome C assembly protein [Macrococcus sp. IME1552]QRN50211.1 cytochrome c biogenesis protein CcsA [Macrococcus bohemicus]QYA44061.1 cytochrome c biogenesis protein [Macrococcus bohemicus]TDL40730.1 cytochrome C assembly protein [Macrococcus bohemicus]
MNELLLMRLHEAILILYMISIACYFFDFVEKSRRLKRYGYLLLLSVFLLQSSSIILFIFIVGRIPIETINEGFYFFTWLIILISLILSKVIRTEFFIFLMNLIGFVFMMIHTFQPLDLSTGTTVSHMMNELLWIHVTLAIVSYVMFLIAALHAVLYLTQMHQLKQKKFNHKFFRIGDLESLSRFVQVFSIIGCVMLLISLILGIYWGITFEGKSIWVDSKVLGSLLLLIGYSVYIFLHQKNKLMMHRLMDFNIVLFLLLLINYLIVSRFSGFHQLFY